MTNSITADEIWNNGTGGNDELVAILTSHGVIGAPDEQRADALIKVLIQWRNVSSLDVAEKYQAAKAALEVHLTQQEPTP